MYLQNLGQTVPLIVCSKFPSASDAGISDLHTRQDNMWNNSIAS